MVLLKSVAWEERKVKVDAVHQPTMEEEVVATIHLVQVMGLKVQTVIR